MGSCRGRVFVIYIVWMSVIGDRLQTRIARIVARREQEFIEELFYWSVIQARLIQLLIQTIQTMTIRS
jgi:hypothetical protein